MVTELNGLASDFWKFLAGWGLIVLAVLVMMLGVPMLLMWQPNKGFTCVHVRYSDGKMIVGKFPTAAEAEEFAFALTRDGQTGYQFGPCR